MSTEGHVAGRGGHAGVTFQVAAGYRLEAAIISDHKLGALKQPSFILVVQETRNLKSRCQHWLSSLRGLREGSFLHLPAFGAFQ